MLVRTYAWISILSDGGILNSILQFFGFEPIKMMYTDFGKGMLVDGSSTSYRL